MRVVDIMMAFPGILMALVVVTVRGQGTLNVMLAVGVSLIPTFVRLVRADVLSIRENAYVEAAWALVGPSSSAPRSASSASARAPDPRVGHRPEQRAPLSSARVVDFVGAAGLHHADGGGRQPRRRCAAR
jgi:hypothetical protein